MKIIALEEHTVDRSIAQATSTITKENIPYHQTFMRADMPATPTPAQLFEMGRTRLEDMDRCGIDMEILSLAGQTQWIEGKEALTLASKANDRLASLVEENPSRFRFFATLPWSHPAEAADELRRTVAEKGAVGALIPGRPRLDATFLDDKAYDPVWKALCEVDLPIYIHPGFPCREISDTYYKGFNDAVGMLLSSYGFGWHLEAGIQVLRMILSGVFDRFPRLKVISGHWGELMPYYLTRFDQTLPRRLTLLDEEISTYFKRNVWVTPSGIYDYDDMNLCINKLGIDHLLFSADYPYIPQDEGRSWLENAPLSQEDKEKFAFVNAQKLLRL